MDEGLRRLVIVVAVLTAAVLALILISSLFMVLMMGWMMSGGLMSGMMGRMGATVKVTFPAAGVYKLTTKAGEDYMQGMKTIGEDNVLKLTVTVK